MDQTPSASYRQTPRFGIANTAGPPTGCCHRIGVGSQPAQVATCVSARTPQLHAGAFSLRADGNSLLGRFAGIPTPRSGWRARPPGAAAPHGGRGLSSTPRVDDLNGRVNSLRAEREGRDEAMARLERRLENSAPRSLLLRFSATAHRWTPV